ncbi:hypothetical protein CAPTEDRAFT_205489 [Capitella teleta]|uniref:Apple domain-containing protein n=1 Tax=Capitella teleta TaxID=283909 RepID=R7TA51_CAPTE|nr:hypothetical protein CAPTEDRAFT_205489 [Capitella teleta]|eukprot:ELT88260.1 hypothetical protein CAPTEDRAFT_205489 [Capitella teleta]
MRNIDITSVCVFALLAYVTHALLDGCSWVNVRAKRLMAWNNVTVKIWIIETCKFMCVHHKGFKCRSVDFSPKERTYVPSDGDRVDSYLRDYNWNNWQYSEIQCKNEWRNRRSCTLMGPIHGKAMPGSALKSTIRHISTVQKCEAACRQEQRFFCISCNFKRTTGMCALQELDTKMSPLAQVPTFDYYELNCDPGVYAMIWQPPAPVGRRTMPIKLKINVDVLITAPPVSSDITRPISYITPD